MQTLTNQLAWHSCNMQDMNPQGKLAVQALGMISSAAINQY